MLAIIIILAIFLVGAATFIFWLLQVLKNTLDMTDGLMNIIENKQPTRLKKAYNDKYYPATIIAQLKFSAEWEGQITDFSLYDKYKIVGITIMSKESKEKYYGEDLIAELEEIGEDAVAQLTEPVIMKVIFSLIMFVVLSKTQHQTLINFFIYNLLQEIYKLHATFSPRSIFS